MTANKMRGVVVTGAWLLSIAASLSVTACEKGASKAPADNAPVPATTPPPAATPPGPPPPAPGDLPPPPDVKAPPADAEKTASGLAYKVLTPGKGKEKPALADTVSVHYTGWTTDGHMFDSSVKRGAPAKFPVGGVIKGWTEALQLMVVGEKRRLWIPGALAYGDTPSRPGAPVGPLVFDIELLSIK